MARKKRPAGALPLTSRETTMRVMLFAAMWSFERRSCGGGGRRKEEVRR
jgi:hypothetical protein